MFVQLHNDDRVVLSYNNKHDWDGGSRTLRTIIVQDGEGEFYLVLTGEVTPMQLDPEWVKEWQLMWKGDFPSCMKFFGELVEDLEIEESKRHFQYKADAMDREMARKTSE